MMNTLQIDATKYTPFIRLDPDGILEISGKSYPENTFEFYQPLLEWLEEYFQNPAKKTILNMEIIYFNSSSSKLFFDLFDLFEENQKKTDLTINWIYDKENETALEAGEEFQEDFETLHIHLQEKT